MPAKKKETAPKEGAVTPAAAAEEKPTAAAAKKPAAKKAAAAAAKVDEAAAPPKPAPKKKPSAKKTARTDDAEDEAGDSVTSPTAADPSIAAAAPTKKLRRESSTGESSSMMTATADLENLSQEVVEKDTVLFDYDACLKANNSTAFPSSTHYKVITWNVAGIRALVKNGYDKSELKQLVAEEQPDVLCLQETKLSDSKEAVNTAIIPDYTFVESLSTAKLGYAGTRTYLRNGVFNLEKSKHFYGFDLIENPSKIDDEGRIVTSFLFPAAASTAAQPLTIINNYVPNSGMKLERLDFRVADYDRVMRQFLAKQVPTIEGQLYGANNSQMVWLGDLNVAERNYDRFHNGNFKGMQKVPGFTPAERKSFRQTLAEAKLVDSFRHFYPNHRGAYTFFSRMFNQRAKGNGWRLDYFAVSAAMVASGRLAGTSILSKYTGSDHIPSVLYLKK